MSQLKFHIIALIRSPVNTAISFRPVGDRISGIALYKQTFTHTCVEFDGMHFGAGCFTCLGRMWPYYPQLWKMFSVDFRGIFFYFRHVGVSSYCSHRDHCVHADQQSDQILSASGISQLKSSEAIVLVKKQNEAIVLVIKIKPSRSIVLAKTIQTNKA